jgi:hypothetical protein
LRHNHKKSPATELLLKMPILSCKWDKCERCGRARNTQLVLFKANVSYFFRRTYSETSGCFCFPCTTLHFVAFEMTTLFFTWWGIIGMIVGPLYLLHNVMEYMMALLGFAFKKQRTPDLP